MLKRLHPDPEIEALIHRLNASANQSSGSGSSTSDAPDGEGDGATFAGPLRLAVRWPLPDVQEEDRSQLRRLLHLARARHGSDLLLVAGKPPSVRVDGDLEPLAEPALEPATAAKLCAALAPAARLEQLQREGVADFAFTGEGLGRFRCNVHRSGGQWAAALRLLPEVVPDFGALNLPQVLERFCELRQGLVLVTGPAGSGKSTTLAAMVRRLLRSRPRIHLVTIEDPVEFTTTHGEAVVEHIEIGRDASSFAGALRASLRQNPDVLLVGEMRDPESISIAITAAETGHLVLSTLHTVDAPQTIHRILDSYPAAQLETVRAQLSISLAGVISQQLLPRRDGPGRVPAVEVLIATSAVRNLVRQGKISHLRSQITLERSAGMLSLDQSLARLVRQNLVTEEAARHRARIPEEIAQLLRRPEEG